SPSPRIRLPPRRVLALSGTVIVLMSLVPCRINKAPISGGSAMAVVAFKVTTEDALSTIRLEVGEMVVLIETEAATPENANRPLSDTLPATSSLALTDGVVVPIPMLPLVETRNRSLPPVVTATALDTGLNKPVFVLAPNENPGAVAEPAPERTSFLTSKVKAPPPELVKAKVCALVAARSMPLSLKMASALVPELFVRLPVNMPPRVSRNADESSPSTRSAFRFVTLLVLPTANGAPAAGLKETAPEKTGLALASTTLELRCESGRAPLRVAAVIAYGAAVRGWRGTSTV